MLAFFAAAVALVVLSFFCSLLLNIVDAVFLCYAMDREAQVCTCVGGGGGVGGSVLCHGQGGTGVYVCVCGGGAVLCHGQGGTGIHVSVLGGRATFSAMPWTAPLTMHLHLPVRGATVHGERAVLWKVLQVGLQVVLPALPHPAVNTMYAPPRPAPPSADGDPRTCPHGVQQPASRQGSGAPGARV